MGDNSSKQFNHKKMDGEDPRIHTHYVPGVGFKKIHRSTQKYWKGDIKIDSKYTADKHRLIGNV